jgi:hypothetical protein
MVYSDGKNAPSPAVFELPTSNQKGAVALNTELLPHSIAQNTIECATRPTGRGLFLHCGVLDRDLGVPLPLEFSLGFCHREIP